MNKCYSLIHDKEVCLTLPTPLPPDLPPSSPYSPQPPPSTPPVLFGRVRPCGITTSNISRASNRQTRHNAVNCVDYARDRISVIVITSTKHTCKHMHARTHKNRGTGSKRHKEHCSRAMQGLRERRRYGDDEVSEVRSVRRDKLPRPAAGTTATPLNRTMSAWKRDVLSISSHIVSARAINPRPLCDDQSC